MLFPFVDYWWLYGLFIVLVLAVLILDLGVFHRKAHEVSFKEASAWTAVWVALALLFNLGFYFYARHSFSQNPALLALEGFDPEASARQVALEFLAGFLVEKSLAIDNIFVFALIFSYFAIPRMYQHRILFYGILGAVFFRALFVALGSYLMAYHAVVVFFGVLLVVTGIKMVVSKPGVEGLEKNPLFRFLQRIIPMHPRVEGASFFVRREGKLKATPIFVALALVEFSDIIFAIDSVPAIFALTKEPLVVFTSNIFAILGLRSMYFMLSGVMDKFAYLKFGLAAVLIFVGLKMAWLNQWMGGKFPVGLSLGIIAGLVGASVLASWLFPPKAKTAPSSAPR